MSNDNVLMEFLVQEVSACKAWIRQCDRQSFEAFYCRALTSLKELGIETLNSEYFYDIPLKVRVEELGRLENNHRLELEAAFIAVWLSSDMKGVREEYHKQATIKTLNRL